MEELEQGQTILTEKDIKDFAVGIQNGCFMWKVELLDNEIYQIKYTTEQYLTPKGNKSKRKVYFVRKNNEKLIFSDEVRKRFMTFRMPYLRSGI